MKPPKCRNWSGRIQSLIPPAITIAIFAGLNLLMREPAWAAGVVTSCTDASLRAAMAGGGTVTFACDGTITLTYTANTISVTTNAVLDGTGHQITISGPNLGGVFFVSNNVTLALVNLTVTNGATGAGGAIYIQSGTLCATNCTFTGNHAASVNMSNPSRGGAILNDGGNLNLRNCLFTNNVARAGGTGVNISGYGGAIFNTGSLNADNCQFVGNMTGGSLPWSAGYPGSGSVNGVPGYGGAIYNSGAAVISRSSFISNSVVGGSGGTPYGGHANTDGGNGADAYGSAICSQGTLLLVNCTVAANTAIGGTGGAGALGGGGIPDGKKGASGSAYGAIYGSANLVNVTVALNSASGAFAVGGVVVSGVSANTLLAGNSPSNSSGTITDGGHNLSSDASCAFTAAGSMNSTDPKLGPLADNGGPTWTMALLPGSPAIDAGFAIGAPDTDQRGVPRPQGAGVDIGAFEYQYLPVFTGATMLNATNCRLQMAGLPPNQTYSLQVSSNLVTWSSVTNFMAGSNGVFQCVDPTCTSGPARFYRLKSGIP